MKITINKSKFISTFLDPVSRITDKGIIIIQKDSMYTLSHNTNNGNTIILYGNIIINTGLNDGENIKLNIPDVKRLCRLLDCINDPIIDLDIDSNSINYNSNNVRFKYHLMEEGIISATPASTETINKLSFDNTFVLTNDKLTEILKSSSVVPNSNKIYFYTKDNCVYAELTDKNIQNLDSITVFVSDAFNGSEIKTSIPLNIDLIRMFSGIKTQNINVKINTQLKVFLFEISNQEFMLKYILSGLVK